MILKLASISDGYIEYLRESCPTVMDNKFDERVHKRLYLGVVLTINEFNYFVPLSSPKPYDYTKDGKIRPSSHVCSRIILHDKNGVEHLYGKLMYKYMIPVPDKVLTDYIIDEETDEKYRDVVSNEYYWITLHIGEIKRRSKEMYDFKIDESNSSNPNFKQTVDFKKVEEACRIYSLYVK